MRHKPTTRQDGSRSPQQLWTLAGAWSLDVVMAVVPATRACMLVGCCIELWCAALAALKPCSLQQPSVVVLQFGLAQAYFLLGGLEL